MGKGYIYTTGSYLFGSCSRTEDGEWFGNRFVRKLPADADTAQLGKLVRQALGRTRRGIPTRNRSRYAASSSRRSAFCRVAGVKSAADMQNWADLVALRAQETLITLVPSFNYRGYAHIEGHQLYESQAVQVAPACSDEELGQAVLTAKGLCSRAE